MPPVPRAADAVLDALPGQGPRAGALPAGGAAEVLAVRELAEGGDVHHGAAGGAGGVRGAEAGALHPQAVQAAGEVHRGAAPAGGRQGHVLLRERLLPHHPQDLQVVHVPAAGARDLPHGRDALAQGAAGVAQRAQGHPEGDRQPGLRQGAGEEGQQQEPAAHPEPRQPQEGQVQDRREVEGALQGRAAEEPQPARAQRALLRRAHRRRVQRHQQRQRQRPLIHWKKLKHFINYLL